MIRQPMHRAGGKCREAADAYAHASGAEFEEVVDNARELMAQGSRNVRVQVGMAGYGSQHKDQGRPQALHDKPLFDRAAQNAPRDPRNEQKMH
jgi:mannonate dehydratase